MRSHFQRKEDWLSCSRIARDLLREPFRIRSGIRTLRVLLKPMEASDCHLPDGRLENSPPFQGWDCVVECPSPEGTIESLPQIPLVALDVVFLEQRAELLLKGHFTMMVFLVFDVLKE